VFKAISNRTRQRLARQGLLLVAVLCALSVAGYALSQHVTREPAFCASCHGAAAESALQHAHKTLRCQDCHSASTLVGLHVLATRWLGADRLPAHGRPSQRSCQECHSGPSVARRIQETGGHVVHVFGKRGGRASRGAEVGVAGCDAVAGCLSLTCGQCHQLAGHQVQANRTVCAQCHAPLVMHESGMVRVTCLDCHDFKAAPTRQGTVPANGCPKCHDGRTLASDDPGRGLQSSRVVASDVTHGNSLTCRLCHDPHRVDRDARRLGHDCETCHRSTVAQARQAGTKGHPDCSTCHQTHGPRPKTPSLCVPCHQNLQADTKSPTLASRHTDCSTCHRPHSFDVASPACAQCHSAQAAQLAAWTQSHHSDCLACHRGHTPARATDSCIGCHKQMQQHGHGECVQCHAPHESKLATRTCVSCHGTQKAIVTSQRVAEHRNCVMCHEQHSPLRAADRCSDCHPSVVGTAARSSAEAHKRCGSCHRPHQFAPSTGVCLDCHKSEMLGAHDSACNKCHRSHGPAASAPLTCRNCHDKVRAIAGRHAECGSCHTPHRSSQGGPACAACHAVQVAGTNQWQSAAHRDCQSCHERHAPIPSKRCAECHAPLAGRQLSKGHSCQGCHAPHQAPSVGFGGCEKCHIAEASAAKTQRGTHATCKSCHEPHTDRLPSCQGCHSSRPGSHATPGHAKCRSCHETHAAKALIRDECLTCHTDKKDHYPTVARCANCHLFVNESGVK